MMEQGVWAAMSEGEYRCSVRPLFVRDCAGLPLALEAYGRALWTPMAVARLFWGDVVFEDDSASRDCSTDPSQLSRTSRRSSCALSGCRDARMASLTSVDSSSLPMPCPAPSSAVFASLTCSLGLEGRGRFLATNASMMAILYLYSLC